MTEFLNGPAKGVKLMLRRAPHFLRAVLTRRLDALEWDALDQVDDVPRVGEEIYVYEMVGEPSWMHIRATKGGGIYRGGKYRLVDPQPPGETMRSCSAWQAWAQAQFEKVHDESSDRP